MPNLAITACLVPIIFTSTVAATEGQSDTYELNPAQQLFFMDDHLRGVEEGSILNYRFISTANGAEMVTDRVRVFVTAVDGQQKRSLSFDFLSGTRHIEFAPSVGYVGNPVLIHYLEYDIQQMAKAVGGGNGYFRNVIRRSFRTPQMRHTKITFEGKVLDATEIVVKPFVADRNIDKFRSYEDKRYEFIFSRQIPGGVYSIHSLVPGKDGEATVIEETLTFSGLKSET